MTQTLYAHMIKKKKKEKRMLCDWVTAPSHVTFSSLSHKCPALANGDLQEGQTQDLETSVELQHTAPSSQV
jgi:hypothetical protein